MYNNNMYKKNYEMIIWGPYNFGLFSLLPCDITDNQVVMKEVHS